MFIVTVRKYTRARKLTPRMLDEPVERIEVYHVEKVNGVQIQKIRIHYNCVGSIETPDMFPLPEPDVCIQTGCQLRSGAGCYMRAHKKTSVLTAISNAIRTLDMANHVN